MRAALLFALAAAAPVAAPTPAVAQPRPALSPADQAAAFRAAGFTRRAGKWQACGDPGTASYTPGTIEEVRDIDGDGLPEAVITEGSVACFGNTGTGYAIVSKQPGDTWKLITGGPGIPRFLPRAASSGRGTRGWPDIEIGGPGFCFPVERWNGREYALHRHQYEGKQCRPRR